MRDLGSMKGMTSIKFGSYLRDKKKKKRPKNYRNDDEYSWMKKFGDKREEVFENVKKEILQIIEFAESGDFTKIDDIPLSDLFKWKVASLYSNERLVPIFKRDVLNKIVCAGGRKHTTSSVAASFSRRMTRIRLVQGRRCARVRRVQSPPLPLGESA